jgi:hypothetical protein
MREGMWSGVGKAASYAGFALLGYGTVTLLLQMEVPQKLVRGAMGYGGWIWGNLSDLPMSWSAPTDVDEPLRSLYSVLSLGQPLLPWVAWVVGGLLLVVRERGRGQGAVPEAIEAESAGSRAGWRPLLSVWLPLAIAFFALVAGVWLRVGNLLPAADGRWTGSNYDEMVYLTEAEAWLRGAWAYRDTFMPHPPGVIWAFAPALLFERAWGGVGAFVAARQWLLVYSVAAIPLAWVAARKLGGAISGGIAALVLALDGKAAFAPQSDRRLPNVGLLETLANVTSLGALALYLYAPEEGRGRRWWLLSAGIVAGVSALCKVPGIAMLAALVIYSLAARRFREAAYLLVGGAAGAGALALPFFVAAPGQMVRQALLFQLLRPQEVREGIDQAARIATYPEAQLTLMLAGCGLVAIAVLVSGQGAGGSKAWALPVLWAAPIVAAFVLSRSFHSQYYTQWVAPLAVMASALGARQFWVRASTPKVALVALLALLALPLVFSQWRVASFTGYDEVYRRVGAALAGDTATGEAVMAYDPGFNFAAGLPPAGLPSGDGNRFYIIDTAGYTIYTAEEIDRAPWGELVGRVLSFRRERNEPEVLARPEAQAALLAGALGADKVVLDQKIALPKLTAQSVRLLEAKAERREDIGYASILHFGENGEAAASMSPFPLDLVAATVARPDGDLTPLIGSGALAVEQGGVVQVGLYWRPGGYPASDLRVVVRLEDAGGASVKQVDTEPSEGSAHTTQWRPGFVYPDIRNIPLEGIGPGSYHLMVRVYDPASGAAGQEVRLGPVVEVK